MKQISIILLLLASFINKSFAQTNFYKLSIGAGAGATLAYADLDKKTVAFASYGSVDYLITPYVTIGLEVQKGELAGGDITFDKNNRQFINSFITANGNIKFAIGELFKAYHLNNNFLYNIRGLYASSGFGFIKNKVTNVRYYGDNFFPGADSSIEGIVPVGVGINFYLPNKWGYTAYTINVNLQTSIAIGEGLDGYGHSTPERNDMYSFFSLGFKYNFGPMGLDRRR